LRTEHLRGVSINSSKHMWVIRVTSGNSLSGKERDLIAELIDNEAHNVEEKYSFVLHNILEDKKSCEAIIEGSKLSVKNIVKMLTDNIQYNISYRRLTP